MHILKGSCWLALLLSTYISAGELFLTLRKFELTAPGNSIDGAVLSQCIIVTISDESKEALTYHEKEPPYWIVRDKNKHFEYCLEGSPNFNAFTNNVVFTRRSGDKEKIECRYSAVHLSEGKLVHQKLFDSYLAKFPLNIQMMTQLQPNESS